MSTPSAVYLYAVVQSPRRPTLSRAPEGLPDTGPLRLLEAGPLLWLVVADAPLTRYGAAPIEEGLRDIDWVAACATAHEQVVRHFARRLTTVPMRLFTLFRTDERAQDHVRRSRARLLRILARVDGCEEWGVRVFAADDAPRPQARPLSGPDAGRRFLEQKSRQHRTTTSDTSAATRAAQSVVRALAPTARAQRRLPIPSGATTRLLVDAAFLVPRDGLRQFRGAVAKAIDDGKRRGVRVALTGPWPPYNFAASAR